MYSLETMEYRLAYRDKAYKMEMIKKITESSKSPPTLEQIYGSGMT